MLHAIVHPADIQDRDGGALVLNTLFGRFPFLTKLFADGGYQGPVFAGAAAHAMPGLSVEIVKRSDTARGFEVLPKRWVVERSLAGSGGVAGWRKISRTSTGPRWRSFAWRPFDLMLRRLCNNSIELSDCWGGRPHGIKSRFGAVTTKTGAVHDPV